MTRAIWKQKVKFPCGYEIEIYAEGDRMKINNESPSKCPMHGKKCKK